MAFSWQSMECHENATPSVTYAVCNALFDLDLQQFLDPTYSYNRPSYSHAVPCSDTKDGNTGTSLKTKTSFTNIADVESIAKTGHLSPKLSPIPGNGGISASFIKVGIKIGRDDWI